mmetsp:Transcript_62184/g.110179  ORF Transcript_62184/g.110179 Transcript_62184/m.110179 type:complete len:93 (+) Transcript_62184:353-631(+)
MLLRRFEFDLDMEPVNPQLLGVEGPGEDQSIARVGMKAAATIHTAKGLFCKVPPPPSPLSLRHRLLEATPSCKSVFPEGASSSEASKELSTA